MRPALVIPQIGLSLILLCGAALLMQSLRNMANVPLGMETSSLFSAYAELPGGRYPQPAQRAAFWKSSRSVWRQFRALRRLESQPRYRRKAGLRAGSFRAFVWKAGRGMKGSRLEGW